MSKSLAARLAIIIAMVVAASGCAMNTALLDKQLETRLVSTLPGDEAFSLSKWGPISFGSKLADADAKVIKQLRELLALLITATPAIPMPAAAASAPAVAPVGAPPAPAK